VAAGGAIPDGSDASMIPAGYSGVLEIVVEGYPPLLSEGLVAITHPAAANITRTMTATVHFNRRLTER
jgi:hypothetical protein